MEECLWQQKSRVLSFKVGDCNTTYFRRMFSCKRYVNVITPFMVGLSEPTLLSDLKRVVTDAFKVYFQSSKAI